MSHLMRLLSKQVLGFVRTDEGEIPDDTLKIRFGLVAVDEEELAKRRKLFKSDDPKWKGRSFETLGARYLLPDQVTIDFLVRHGFLQELSREKKEDWPSKLGNPYEDKGFYHHESTMSFWPQDSGFEPGGHYRGHIKRFTLVDRFGSDYGSFLCEARFKTKEVKKEVCKKILDEIHTYKLDFINKNVLPLCKKLFKQSDNFDALQQELKEFLEDVCKQYYKFVDEPDVRKFDFPLDAVNEVLGTILVQLKRPVKPEGHWRLGGSLPQDLKDSVEKFFGDDLSDLDEEGIFKKCDGFVKAVDSAEYKFVESLYDWYMDRTGVDSYAFGEQQLVLQKVEGGFFKKLTDNLNDDIFVTNVSYQEKMDFLLWFMPYLALNLTVFDKINNVLKTLALTIRNMIANLSDPEKGFKCSVALKELILENLETPPITRRAMNVSAEMDSDYSLFMVTENLSAEIGDAAPWFSSLKTMRQDQLRDNSHVKKLEEGQLLYENSCSTLLKEGYLLKIVSFEKKDGIDHKILYGRDG